MSDSIHPTQALLAQAAWVRALALELVRDGGEAEDLAQETILRALEHPPREIGSLRGFLRSVLSNARLQRARGESRRRVREQRAARAEALPGTDELVERLALHRRVVEAVQELEEPYRNAILLRFFDGLPPREIARRSGLPVKTVNTHLQRGLARLRLGFDRECENDRRRWVQAFLPLLGAPGARPSVSAAGATRWFVAALGGLAVALLFWSVLRPERQPEDGARTPLIVFGSTPASAAGSASLALDPSGAEWTRMPVGGEAAVRVTGHVRTHEGEPVGGASVELLHLPSATFEVRAGTFARASSSVGTTRTDAQGNFELEVGAARSWPPWRLVVRSAGLGTEMRDDVFGHEPVEVELRRAGRFEFTLLARENRLPCAGARLVLSRQGLRDPLFEGTSAADGRAVIEALAPGLYTIEATPGQAERVFAIDLVLREGESVAHTLQVREGSALEGRVRSARSGEPVSGARLRAENGRDALTDDAGGFRLAGLSADRPLVALTVEASGFAPLSRSFDARALPPAGPVLELEPEGRAQGTIAGAEGAPVAGAWILAGAGETRSGPDGSFELCSLLPGSRPLLFVRAQGHATLAALFPRDVAEGAYSLGEIRLAPAARLSGRVCTRSGAPLAGARVELEALGPPLDLGRGASQVGLIANGEGDEGSTTTVTILSASRAPQSPPAPPPAAEIDASPYRDRSVRADSRGRFRLLDLAAGRYRISSRAVGRCTAPAQEIELAPGENRSDVELVYEDGLAIAGRVVGVGGEAIPGAWLVLSTAEGPRGGAAHLSELDGGFELSSLADGLHELEVSFHGSIGSGADAHTYARTILHGLRPPVRDLEIRLSLDLFVEGELLDGAGQPIADVYVESRDAEGRRDSAATDRNGRFRVGAAEGTTVALTVGGPVIRTAAEAARAGELPRWTGELSGVVAGSRDLVLNASRTR